MKPSVEETGSEVFNRYNIKMELTDMWEKGTLLVCRKIAWYNYLLGQVGKNFFNKVLLTLGQTVSDRKCRYLWQVVAVHNIEVNSNL